MRSPCQGYVKIRGQMDDTYLKVRVFLHSAGEAEVSCAAECP